MKKRIALIVAAVMMLCVLSGCCLQHEWIDANCVAPQTCAKCEKTEGEALGHTMAEADCVTPATCTVCGATEGEALGHTMAEADCVTPATCTVCGETEGEALGHQANWVASVDNFEEMTGTCDVCGEALVEAVDWEAVAPSFILGRWDGRMVQVDGKFYDLDEGITFDIREDGTATLDMIDEKFELTWSVKQTERFSEDGTIEILAYQLLDEEGGEYTLAVTYIFGSEVNSIYFYIGDNVMVFRKG